MALSPSFTCKIMPNISHRSLTSLSYVRSQSSCRRNLHTPRVKVVIPKPIFRTTNIRKCISHQKKPEIGCKFAAKSDSSSEFNTVSHVIKKFCKCINEDNMTELENLISRDCYIEDTLFKTKEEHKSGKEEVKELIYKLARILCIQNLQLELAEPIPGKEELTATANWRLVHKDSPELHHKNIRGFSTFQCSYESDTLVIRKLVNITESNEGTNQEPSSSPEQS
ncbi:uncharacterized protein LOC110719562 [Chenopodium quinoa]|uniref:uncharacterized protein LOC110719562 n=1 Tax=Chenopodium quinoa TaxID=63459 RepID=UPI000B78607E|nr:uncharacterized protein LOC110719562 [Chenopodium quinoa]